MRQDRSDPGALRHDTTNRSLAKYFCSHCDRDPGSENEKAKHARFGRFICESLQQVYNLNLLFHEMSKNRIETISTHTHTPSTQRKRGVAQRLLRVLGCACALRNSNGVT